MLHALDDVYRLTYIHNRQEWLSVDSLMVFFLVMIIRVANLVTA